MNNILIIGAHYDDTELGVGGTASKFVDEGKKVYKLTLTNNVTRSSHLNLNIEYETSLQESAMAAAVLGMKELTEFEPIECTRLFYSTETMQRIEDLIYRYNIDTVFTHFKDDANQDHIEASKLCRTAARHCDNLFAYQSNFYILDAPYYPTFFVDISKYVAKKIEALKQYEGQHNRFSRLFETCIERNKIWGFSNKVAYAEGFQVLKILDK
jgi:LmbE family N-acetylglucosaminyl deacetylase